MSKTDADTQVVMQALHAADHSVHEVGWILQLKNNLISLYYFRISPTYNRLEVCFFF